MKPLTQFYESNYAVDAVVTATSTFPSPTVDVNNNGKALICEVEIRIAILIKFSGTMYVSKGKGHFMTCLHT